MKNKAVFGDERLPSRFWNKLSVQNNGCWLWIAGHGNGYGSFWINGENRNAHQLTFELIHDKPRIGTHLDHTCRNRGCANPEHLEPVSIGENVLRGVGITAQNKNKSRCPRGHSYDMRYSTGKRGCKACNREKTRQFRMKRRNQDVIA